jgi:hypothetical protein
MRTVQPNEAEFLAAGVDEMLRRLSSQAGERRLRLFACGCCRQVWPLLDNPRTRLAVALAERRADGQASEEEVLPAPRSTAGLSTVAVAWAAEAVAVLTAWGTDLTEWGALNTVHVVAEHAARALRDVAGVMTWTAARRRQSALLFDILGKLDQPIALNPRWLDWNDGTLRRMADTIYREHRFADMPILGDALEEAGCDRVDLLAHCREYVEHARGCWLVDAIRAKAVSQPNVG